MKTRLLFGLKYVFFAFIAFTVPKMIVDSGRIVAPLEPSPPSSTAARPPKSRSFWPFHFLQAPDAPTPVDATPRRYARYSAQYAESARVDATRDAVAPAHWNDSLADFAPDARADFNGRADFNASVASAATLENRDSALIFSPPSLPRSSAAPFDAPIDDRASFARFAESRFSPDAALSASPSLLSPSAAPPRTFEELFRFGHSPAWLVENWPRVDAVATEDGLVGYRVAVSTGSANDDLTGVFACYFDATSERRVEFSGQTGDYRRLLDFLRREYGVSLSADSTAENFRYESTLSNGRGGRLPGRLTVRPARVFLRGAENSFFEVDVVLERPYNR